jgi:peptide subunit release factor 1 (eRF1)
VLEALNQRRVEALIVEDGFSAPGVECLRCGWIGPDATLEQCPADGDELEQREDIGEQAVERALMQDAEVMVLRDRPDLGPHRGIGAVLRF